jgi:lauroyl/myristoyl acyltransferase
MAIVLGLPKTDPRVNNAVVRAIENGLYSYIDLFRALSSKPGQIRDVCGLDHAVVESVKACLANKRGLLLVGAHMCSFDLFLLGLTTLVPSAQLLSNADPKGSSKTMNRIRARQGLNLTPISMQSLRKAMTTLKDGGVVAIAADIPAENGEELGFFGHRSRLLVGHVRLAQKADAEIAICAPHRLGAGRYRVQTKIVPRPTGISDQRLEMLRWAQDTLQVLETFISQWPDQWLMPQPVWPG